MRFTSALALLGLTLAKDDGFDYEADAADESNTGVKVLFKNISPTAVRSF